MDWIAKKRKELEKTRENMLANVTAIAGALQLLEQMERDGVQVDDPKDGGVKSEVVKD